MICTRYLRGSTGKLYGLMLATFFVGVWPVDAVQAAPTFMWLEPWQVSIPPAPVEGIVSRLSANFGASATADRQIADIGNAGDIGPATAFARAVVAVQPPSSGQSEGTLQVIFVREFRLSDSPLGWSVSVNGFLAGLLTNAVALNSSALVIAEEGIATEVAVDGNVGLRPTKIQATSTAELKNRVSTGSDSGMGTGFLADGIYDAFGELTVDATIASGTGPVILSNFFDGAAGFSVTVDAMPIVAVVSEPPLTERTFFVSDTSVVEISESVPPAVPAPATLMLVGTGLLALLWSRRGQQELD